MFPDGSLHLTWRRHWFWTDGVGEVTARTVTTIRNRLAALQQVGFLNVNIPLIGVPLYSRSVGERLASPLT